MKKYKAVICDFDYTLADATDGIAMSINYALEKLGFDKAPLDKIRETVGYMLEDALTMLTGCDEADVQAKFVDLFREYADGVMVESTKILEHTEYFMNKVIASGAKFAIVSSKESDRIIGAFTKWGMQDKLDLVLGCLELEKPKPDKCGLVKAATYFALSTDECLYVGDTVIDATASKNAQMDFAAVTTGTTDAETLSEYPNVGIFANLKELADKLID